jgi:hypothetical protein
MARLDRIYIFQNQAFDPGQQLLRYIIKGDVTRFDHCPVLASLLLEDRPRRASHWKMSDSLFEAASMEIERIWRIQPLDAPFFKKLRKVLKYYKTLCKRHAEALREDEQELKVDLEAATRDLQVDSENGDLQNRHGTAKEKLDHFQARHIVGRKVCSRLRWKWRGDLVSREFFLAVKERSKSATISSLKDCNANRVTGRSELEQTVIEFYKQLYSAPAATDINFSAANIILSHVPHSFTTHFPEEVLTQLDRLPTTAEPKASLDAMATSRSPGPDGILTEFYV